MEFFSWFYSKGVDYYLKSWSDMIIWVNQYFSFSLLLSTLFSPWKRMIEDDTSQGFNIQKKLEIWSFNMVSRFVGASVRLILMFVGLFFLIFAALGGAIGFVFWLILPFFGMPVFNKYKNQPKNFIATLLNKLKVNNLDPLDAIFSSEPGIFVCEHIGVSKEKLISQAQKQKLDMDKLKAESFFELIHYLLSSGLWSEELFNTQEIGKGDMEIAAGWWDKKQEDETRIGGDNYTRPGLALDLTFGYTPTLNKYSVDLSLPQSYSHRLIGRQQIVSRMERILTAGSSVLLMGQPGVGKKTVVLEFAKRAAGGQLGKALSYKRVLEFDYNSLMSETTDLNDKKKKLSQIFAEGAYAGNIILMIRDIQRLTNPEVEGYDFTDIMEERLEGGKLKIIAVSTNSDYERFIAPNLRLRKYLEKVEIVPPSKEEALQILVEAAKRWEKLRGLTITVHSLVYILEQSDRYVTEVPFPEKALEMLDAVVTLKEQKGGNTIVLDDVNEVLAEKTGISFARLTGEEKKRLGNIEEIIHERLIDQENAVNLIGKTLRSKTVGVVKEDRPLGSFLFLGPTGVGKTETAKVLSRVYFGGEESIIRFDMAEYSGAEGLERLIGSVAKNQPGALTTAIKNRPASLLLLDKMEKASKEIYNLFLALLDEGMITDAFGKKILGKHLFIVATSNAGAENIRNLVDKGVKGEELQKEVVNNVLEKEIFSPEFLNRFDGVVVYEPLGPDELLKVAKIMLSELSDNLRKKNIVLEVTDEATRKLASDGYEPAFGARPMKRLININIGDVIGKKMLSGNVKQGDKIKLVPGEGKGEFDLENNRS